MCCTLLECAPRLSGTRPTSVGVCVCVRDGERENRSLDNNEEEDIRVDLEFPSLIWETT